DASSDRLRPPSLTLQLLLHATRIDKLAQTLNFAASVPWLQPDSNAGAHENRSCIRGPVLRLEFEGISLANTLRRNYGKERSRRNAGAASCCLARYLGEGSRRDHAGG